MGSVTKQDVEQLRKRRNCLFKKIAAKHAKNLPVGQEGTEFEALNRVIPVAAAFIGNGQKNNNDDNDQALASIIDSLKEFAPGGSDRDQTVVLKEIMRDARTKLMIARESRGNNEYISFRNCRLDDNLVWKSSAKIKIRLTELEALISVLKINVSNTESKNLVRLIATPELYTACKFMLDAFPDFEGIFPDAYLKLKHAVAKAEDVTLTEQSV